MNKPMFSVEQFSRCSTTGAVEIKARYLFYQSREYITDKRTFYGPQAHWNAYFYITKLELDVFRLNTEFYVKCCQAAIQGHFEPKMHEPSKKQLAALDVVQRYVKWCASPERKITEVFTQYLKVKDEMKMILPPERYYFYMTLERYYSKFIEMTNQVLKQLGNGPDQFINSKSTQPVLVA